MPLLACNYSPQLVSLLEQQLVHVDWIKLSRWDVFWEEFKVARPLRPVLLHCLPHAGRTSFADIEWDKLNEAVQACGSPHIALHLMALPTDWEKPPSSDEMIIERMISGVKLWQEKMSVELLVENVPFYGFRGTFRCATDPEVIQEICRQCGVGLLLDLAHLRVAAWHRKEDAFSYLRKLPLEAVKEIHVSGPALDPAKGLRDGHLEMQEEDYDLLLKALELTQPSFVSLEYGGTGPHMEWRSDADALKRQLIRLHEMV